MTGHDTGARAGVRLQGVEKAQVEAVPGEPRREADVARFNALYEAIAPSLYAWAEIKIRPQMRGLVDPSDVVQEVWYRAWRSFAGASFEAESFRRWIFRVAKNVLLESFRALRGSDALGGAAGESARLRRLAEVPDTATAITRRVARDEGLKLFATWTIGLDEDERALVVHLGLEDMDRAELAARLGLNEATLAKRWERLQARMADSRTTRELFAAVQ
jgi:RNA polymerase sigma factor (sigma-70 family)